MLFVFVFPAKSLMIRKIIISVLVLFLFLFFAVKKYLIQFFVR